MSRRRRVFFGCGALLGICALACVLGAIIGREALGIVLNTARQHGVTATHPLPGRVGLRAGEEAQAYAGRQIDGDAYEAVLIISYREERADGTTMTCNLRSQSTVSAREEDVNSSGPDAYQRFGPLAGRAGSICNCYLDDGDSRTPVATCELFDLPLRYR